MINILVSSSYRLNVSFVLMLIIMLMRIGHKRDI